MTLVSIILFSAGVLVLTGAGIAYTYKETRYKGIDSTYGSEREKYDEKDCQIYAVLSGLSYAGFAVGTVLIFVAMVMFFVSIDHQMRR